MPSAGMGDERSEASRALELDSRFWRFALRVYARPGVSPLCITLQDENGIDLNLLLFAGWCGSIGRRLEAEDIESAATHVAAWSEAVVTKLRQARRAWKELGPAEPAAQAGRETLKSVELLSERLVCAMLHDIHGRLGAPATESDPPSRIVAANLMLVLTGSGADPARAGEACALLTEACLAVS